MREQHELIAGMLPALKWRLGPVFRRLWGFARTASAPLCTEWARGGISLPDTLTPLLPNRFSRF